MICHIVTRSDSVGGAQIHVLELSKAFNVAGIGATVMVGGNGPFIDRLKSVGVPTRRLRHLVRPINPFHDLLAVFELRRELKALQPRLVITHSSKAGFLGRLACRTLGYPVIFTAHGWAFTDGVPRALQIFYRIAERIAAMWSDQIITVSEFDRQLGLAAKLIEPAAIVTVHNGVDENIAMPAAPQKSPVRLICVARLDAQKDHTILLGALAGLKDLEWQLDLVGDGPLRQEYQTLVRTLGITDRVNFLGARNDVPRLLSESQLFVLPSRWEGLPRAILEAMRAGLPAIASSVGGVPECIAGDRTGLLVARGDQAGWEHALRRLISNHDQRAEMGRAARRLFSGSFTSTKMLAETSAVLEKVLAGHNDDLAATAIRKFRLSLEASSDA